MNPRRAHNLNRAAEYQAKRAARIREALANKEYAKAKALLREDVEAPEEPVEGSEGTETGDTGVFSLEGEDLSPVASTQGVEGGDAGVAQPAESRQVTLSGRGFESRPRPLPPSTHPDGTDPWNCDIPWTEHGRCEDKRRVAIGLLPQNHVEDDEHGFVRRSSRLLGPHRPPRTAEERIAAGRKTWAVIAELRARSEKS